MFMLRELQISNEERKQWKVLMSHYLPCNANLPQHVSDSTQCHMDRTTSFQVCSLALRSYGNRIAEACRCGLGGWSPQHLFQDMLRPDRAKVS